MARSRRKVVVPVTGFWLLNRKLRRLAGKDGKKIIRRAAREAVKPVQAAAKQNAPDDTGALRKSIRVRSLKGSRHRVGARVTTSAYDNVFKGRTFYAAFIEFGWFPGKRSRKGNSKKRGRPVMGELFMKNAARDKRRVARSVFKREIKKGIRNLVRK